MQVRERKAALAKLETTDMGKPIQEAEWDMVSVTLWWHLFYAKCHTEGAPRLLGSQMLCQHA